MTEVSSDDVRKVADLARLHLPDEKITIYAKQLEKILNYIDQLEKIDTENVPATTRAVEVVNKFRNDDVVSSNVNEDLLDLAPDREGSFYKVPKILSE